VDDDATRDYGYHDADPTWSNAYIWPVIQRELGKGSKGAMGGERPRALDLGCGNGATTEMIRTMGFDAIGVDPSASGIALAREAYPECHFEQASAYDDLAARFGCFDAVVSLEVIEHCYDPRKMLETTYNLLSPGGLAIISTPYHGYLKNLVLAATGKLDQHFTATWDGGHIKFFSIATLTELLEERGFIDIRFHRVGRWPPLAKSMVAVVAKPA